jgi:hypothetical protein
MGDATTSRQVVALPLPRSARSSVLRDRIREAIDLVIEEELEEALGTKAYGRSTSRQGYRNGSQERSLVTEHGAVKLTVPRARVKREDGVSTSSSAVPGSSIPSCRVRSSIPAASMCAAGSTDWRGCPPL